MFDNQWKRYVVMNTVSAPATVQCKVERIVSKRELIDLSTILMDKEITFEFVIEEGMNNGKKSFN